jgi:D-beta-D-heptose 7-phosphate kinase / D-beta-D-heptose 1-phosphate adenosyltransferase
MTGSPGVRGNGHRRPGGPLVVVGDALLDVDVTGAATRLTPDEPVPVLESLHEQARPGGAALAAWLAAQTYPEVVLVCAVADDPAAARLADLLDGRLSLLGLPSSGTTPVKTRVRAGGRTLLRMDTGGEPGRLAVDAGALRSLLDGAAAVLVADYGQGVARHADVRGSLAAAARTTPVVWDPHPHGDDPVPGVLVATPNADEARRRAGPAPDPGRDDEIARAQRLHASWGCRHVAVTLGSRGAVLVAGSGTPLVVPARPVSATDTCGAGDAFAAAAAVALATGADPPQAVVAAVGEAARYVADGAAAAVRPGRPRATPVPVPSEGSAAEVIAARCRARGGRVVVAGGCFDLLHAGHVAYLQAARSLGDCLIVAMNGDDSLRRLKGDGRPLVPEHDRARILKALACVDDVVVFDEPTPAAVLARLRPDVFAKGGDYLGVDLPEADVVTRYGGRVVAVPHLPGRSTSSLAAALG